MALNPNTYKMAEDFREKPLEERTDSELLQSIVLLQRGSSKRIRSILMYIAAIFWLSIFGAFIYLLIAFAETS